MKGLLPAFVVAAFFSSPAAAQSMTCAQFAGLSDAEKIEEVERLEPKSIEEDGGKTADQTDASSGAKGTVNPNMLESEKVDMVSAACDNHPKMTTGDAMKAAFKK